MQSPFPTRRLLLLVLLSLAGLLPTFAHPAVSAASRADEQLALGCPSPPDPVHKIRVWVRVVKWCGNPAVRGQAQVKLQLRVKNIGRKPLDLSPGHFRLIVRHFDRRRWTPPRVGASTTDRPFVTTHDGTRVWAVPPNADGAFDPITSEVGTFASHWNTSGTLAPGATFVPIDRRPGKTSGRGSLVFYIPIDPRHRRALYGVLGLAYVEQQDILVLCPTSHWGPRVSEVDF
jgi:hypothetical protein